MPPPTLNQPGSSPCHKKFLDLRLRINGHIVVRRQHRCSCSIGILRHRRRYRRRHRRSPFSLPPPPPLNRSVTSLCYKKLFDLRLYINIHIFRRRWRQCSRSMGPLRRRGHYQRQSTDHTRNPTTKSKHQTNPKTCRSF